MTDKQKEEKYLVLKLADIDNYLNKEQKRNLSELCGIIKMGRMLDAKRQNHYIVINEEEPYSEKVWDLVLERTGTNQRIDDNGKNDTGR
jgi:hypothetical protein